MATTLTVQEVPQFDGLTDVPLTAGDAAEGHDFDNDGNTMLLVKNGDVTSKTVTITSVNDQFNRTGDIVLVVAAGKEMLAGPFIPAIWNSGGKVDVGLSADTSVELVAFRFQLRR